MVNEANAVAIENDNIYAKKYLKIYFDEQGFPALDVVNDLTSEATNKPLSAAQGKMLKQLLDNATLEAQSLTFDLNPTQNSANPVTSDGIYRAIRELITMLQGIQVQGEKLVIPSFE